MNVVNLWCFVCFIWVKTCWWITQFQIQSDFFCMFYLDGIRKIVCLTLCFVTSGVWSNVSDWEVISKLQCKLWHWNIFRSHYSLCVGCGFVFRNNVWIIYNLLWFEFYSLLLFLLCTKVYALWYSYYVVLWISEFSPNQLICSDMCVFWIFWMSYGLNFECTVNLYQ